MPKLNLPPPVVKAPHPDIVDRPRPKTKGEVRAQALLDKRKRNEEFMALSLVDQVYKINKSRGTKCHTFMNFIPESFMEQIDMTDEDEVRRWNIIFHYQRHPHHRPREKVTVELTMKEQTVLTRKYAKHNVLIVDIHLGVTQITGYYLTDTGHKVLVELMDFTKGVWQTI